MPTGYTANLMEKGESFPQFVMTCARAFGALITMRDDDQDAPIPKKFESSDYHTKALAEAKKTLASLQKMDDVEKLRFGEKEKDAEIKQLSQWLKKEEIENKRLEEMEAQVKAWTPPTKDHKKLKDFMLNQISISKHDLSYIHERLSLAINNPPMTYFTAAISKAARDINYHTAENDKEVERVNGRNEWLRQLRNSI